VCRLADVEKALVPADDDGDLEPAFALAPNDVNHEEDTRPRGDPDDDELIGSGWVVEEDGGAVREDGGGFLEPDAVLSQIPARPIS
jgi:hypothetical protein